MKYLSFDLEATGLDSKDLIIEFAMVPFCTKEKKLQTKLEKHFYIKCPSFENLKPQLSDWVIEHNKDLIEKAHQEGLELKIFKKELEAYLCSKVVQDYFDHEKITLFGKSMSAIDLPFLTRDLGWDWMRKYFVHRQLDLSSVAYNLVDLGFLPSKCISGSELMNYMGMGEVAHTALEDAKNTAKIYLKLLEKFSSETNT